MIHINLLGEKEDKTGIYVLQGLALTSVVVLSLGICGFYHGEQISQRDQLEGERLMLETQVARLRKQTKKVDELENKRKLLAEKLMTISKLKAKKQGPARVLDDLTGSIPQRAWLRTVTQRGASVEFAGVALDNQTVSLFMRNLEGSEYFRNIELVRSQQYIRDGVKLQQFSLSAASPPVV